MCYDFTVRRILTESDSIQVEVSFLQNERGYRDGSELQKGNKQGVVTQ